MRLLVITEKCGPEDAQRDGGARLVSSLRQAFGDAMSVAQFGDRSDQSATWHFRYPPAAGDRFSRRLALSGFIADHVGEVASGFTDVLFVHASMKFAVPTLAARTWLFPMFLTPSYEASGEHVPAAYTQAELHALATTDRILTPSHLERRQLVEVYGIPEYRIRVVPRGVNRGLLKPRVRALHGPPHFCSIGSIKRQKNTVGLLRLFASLLARHPGAHLSIIGPVQDAWYMGEVREYGALLGVAESVDFLGYVPPEGLADVIAEAHVHLSASTCETFGRSIFETLASGLPNVARVTGNAAAEYLGHVPYARFSDDEEAVLIAVDDILENLPQLSAMATEIGGLFDDVVLSRLLAAEVGGADVLAVADWDGTLFHKDDQVRTASSITQFRRFPLRVVCTARKVPDVVAALATHGLTVDWIVGCSGAVVADGRGQTMWRVPIGVDVPGTHGVLVDGEVVQLSGSLEAFKPLTELRVETYQGTSFASRWDASKLQAVLRLLRYLDWPGRVRTFGDGRYDEEMLIFFDGVRIRALPAPCVTRQAVEIISD